LWFARWARSGAKSVIKDALARGADRAIHVLGDNVGHLSPFAAASVLAEAIRGEQADLIMTGLQSGRLWLCANRSHSCGAARPAARDDCDRNRCDG